MSTRGSYHRVLISVHATVPYSSRLRPFLFRADPDDSFFCCDSMHLDRLCTRCTSRDYFQFVSVFPAFAQPSSLRAYTLRRAERYPARISVSSPAMERLLVSLDIWWLSCDGLRGPLQRETSKFKYSKHWHSPLIHPWVIANKGSNVRQTFEHDSRMLSNQCTFQATAI